MLRWRRRGKRGRIETILLMLLMVLALGAVLAACDDEGQPPTQPPTQPPGGTPSPISPSPSPSQPGGTPQPPSWTPKPSQTCTATNTFTSTPTPNWVPVGTFNLSAYYVVHETQYYSGPGSQSGPIPTLDNITANKYFLFSDAGVCMAGTGKLKDGSYIGCTSHVDWNTEEVINNQYGTWSYMMPANHPKYREGIDFFWKDQPAPPKHKAFETVAVCSSGLIPRNENGNVEIRIDNAPFESIMQDHGADNILAVTDVGGGLCATNGIDVYVGEQPPYPETPVNNFKNTVADPIINIDSASVAYRVLR